MPTISLSATLAAWSQADLPAVLEAELAALPEGALPLVQAMTQGSAPGPSPLRISLLGREAGEGRYQLRVALFFTSIIAGCSCADDPTPVEELPEYALLEIALDPHTGLAEVRLAPE